MKLSPNQTYEVNGKKMKLIEQKQIYGKHLFLFDKQTFSKTPEQLEEFYESISIFENDIEVHDAEVVTGFSQKLSNVSNQAKEICSDLDLISSSLVGFFKTLKDKDSLTREDIAKAQTMSKLSESVAKMQLTKIAVNNNL